MHRLQRVLRLSGAFFDEASLKALTETCTDVLLEASADWMWQNLLSAAVVRSDLGRVGGVWLEDGESVAPWQLELSAYLSERLQIPSTAAPLGSWTLAEQESLENGLGQVPPGPEDRFLRVSGLLRDRGVDRTPVEVEARFVEVQASLKERERAQSRRRASQGEETRLRYLTLTRRYVCVCCGRVVSNLGFDGPGGTGYQRARVCNNGQHTRRPAAVEAAFELVNHVASQSLLQPYSDEIPVADTPCAGICFRFQYYLEDLSPISIRLHRMLIRLVRFASTEAEVAPRRWVVDDLASRVDAVAALAAGCGDCARGRCTFGFGVAWQGVLAPVRRYTDYLEAGLQQLSSICEGQGLLSEEQLQASADLLAQGSRQAWLADTYRRFTSLEMTEMIGPPFPTGEHAKRLVRVRNASEDTRKFTMQLARVLADGPAAQKTAVAAINSFYIRIKSEADPERWRREVERTVVQLVGNVRAEEMQAQRTRESVPWHTLASWRPTVGRRRRRR